MAPEEFQWNFRYVIFKWLLVIDGWGVSCEIALMWRSLDTNDQSTLVQVMACCCQATSHYLSQCWPRSLSPYDVTRPQWVSSDIPRCRAALTKQCALHLASCKMRSPSHHYRYFTAPWRLRSSTTSLFVQQLIHAYLKKGSRSSASAVLYEGSPRLMDIFPHKEPIVRDAFRHVTVWGKCVHKNTVTRSKLNTKCGRSPRLGRPTKSGDTGCWLLHRKWQFSMQSIE